MSRKKKQQKQLGKLQRAVVQVFKTNPNKELNYKQVAAMVSANDAVTKHFVQTAITILKEEEFLFSPSRGKYKLNTDPQLMQGKIDITQSGRAFVFIEELDDEITIPQYKTGTALNGDLVAARATRTKTSGRIEGEVMQVLERAKTTFVGTIEISKNFAFVKPDNRKVHVDFFIDKTKTKGAQNGEKVIVELTDWPEKAKNPYAKVTEVLGAPGENETEIHGILAEYGLPYHFPDKVEKQAEKIPTKITSEEIKARKDLRGITTFTIDPEDAKDFDDALSIEKLDNGNWSIGVHIADVSHYVVPGTDLDKEAYKRGNSVYLVDRVVPMLPEVLSNGLCSLRANEEKLAFSTVFEMDEKAEIKDVWFGKSVIESDKRFVYEEAQEIIDNQEGVFLDELNLLDKLAKIHRKKRLESGALNIESTEVRFRLSESGDPIDLFEKKVIGTNQLIEEFMLLANKKVTEFMAKPEKDKKIVPFVFRIHDSPTPEKLEELKKYLFRFGYKLNEVKDKPISFALNQVMEEAKANNDLHIVAPMCIKSMAKAVYSSDNIGHYGLAFQYYSHFTSPIRRYADLIVHRLLFERLKNEKPSFSEDALSDVCKHISATEKQAVTAERASIKFMQVKYLKEKVGEVFSGKVSGVTEWGLFIELNENKCEGLIRLNSIEGDYYYFDSDKLVVRGQNTKSEIGLGDQLTVKVKNVDLVRKQIDFELINQTV